VPERPLGHAVTPAVGALLQLSVMPGLPQPAPPVARDPGTPKRRAERCADGADGTHGSSWGPRPSVCGCAVVGARQTLEPTGPCPPAPPVRCRRARSTEPSGSTGCA